jgi:hypothetical protein
LLHLILLVSWVFRGLATNACIAATQTYSIAVLPPNKAGCRRSSARQKLSPLYFSRLNKAVPVFDYASSPVWKKTEREAFGKLKPIKFTSPTKAAVLFLKPKCHLVFYKIFPFPFYRMLLCAVFFKTKCFIQFFGFYIIGKYN